MSGKLLRSGVTLALGVLVSLALLGAAPKQGDLPPQPFYADYFSGTVFLQGYPAPLRVQLVACVGGCENFQSEPVLVRAGGAFHLLEVNPPDRFLRGDQITFYLVNAHGRIQALETATFEGAYAISSLNLRFDDPLPSPLPPPMLPQVGDPVLPMLPKAAVVLGTLLLGSGIGILAWNRRELVPPQTR